MAMVGGVQVMKAEHPGVSVKEKDSKNLRMSKVVVQQERAEKVVKGSTLPPSGGGGGDQGGLRRREGLTISEKPRSHQAGVSAAPKVLRQQQQQQMANKQGRPMGSQQQLSASSAANPKNFPKSESVDGQVSSGVQLNGDELNKGRVHPGDEMRKGRIMTGAELAMEKRRRLLEGISHEKNQVTRKPTVENQTNKSEFTNNKQSMTANTNNKQTSIQRAGGVAIKRRPSETGITGDPQTGSRPKMPKLSEPPPSGKSPMSHSSSEGRQRSQEAGQNGRRGPIVKREATEASLKAAQDSKRHQLGQNPVKVKSEGSQQIRNSQPTNISPNSPISVRKDLLSPTPGRQEQQTPAAKQTLPTSQPVDVVIKREPEDMLAAVDALLSGTQSLPKAENLPSNQSTFPSNVNRPLANPTRGGGPSFQDIVPPSLNGAAPSQDVVPSQMEFPAVAMSTAQIDILQRQFQVKDYLSRKEMHQLAKKTNLTVNQVRDWFKDRRTEEEAPKIVEEKKTELLLSNGNNNVKIKQEPLLELEEEAIGNKDVTNNVIGNNEEMVRVKTEPVEEEEEEEGPVSAVLRSKATFLTSLTKKIENATKPVDDVEAEKNQMTEMLNELDPDIEITSENIVNPGKKKKEPLGEVLNQFMTQIEQLEKTIDINEIAKNGNVKKLVRDGERKDARIQDLEEALKRQKTETEATKVDLKNKNEEIESILLNLVSKETFIRTQFQKHQNEIKVLKAEKEQSKEKEEAMVEMKKEVRAKEEEVEDMKEQVKTTQALVEQSRLEMRKLQDKSTKIIGDITKGVGVKLAEAKANEQALKDAVDRAAVLEENFKEMFTKYEEAEKAREKQGEEFKELKEAAQTVSKELKATNDDLLNEGLLLKEENEKLKEQQKVLTKKFRAKVKDIQETLSNFNEKMKEKNAEVGALQASKDAQAQELEKVKEEADVQQKIIAELKERESDLMADLEAERSMRVEYPEENEKSVIANESGFFLIENNESKKSEHLAKKTESKPTETKNETRNVDIDEAELEPKSTSSNLFNVEDNFEEEFNLLDEDEQEDSNDQSEEVNDFEEDAEELKTKAKKRKETSDTEAVQNETQLCLIPESSPMKKSRMLNKRMKMDMSFKSRMRNWKNEDLALLSKDFNPKSFSLDFSPRNIASFSLTWPIVPYKPNEILNNLHNTLDLL